MVLLRPAVGVAAEPPPPPAEPMPYRAGVLLGDLFAATLVAGGTGIFLAYRDCECEEWMSGVFVMLGAGAYLTWSPMVHVDQGHRGRAWLAAALRAGLPMASGLGGYAATADTTGTLLAIAGGALMAMILDWTLLARAPPSPGPAG